MLLGVGLRDQLFFFLVDLGEVPVHLEHVEVHAFAVGVLGSQCFSGVGLNVGHGCPYGADNVSGSQVEVDIARSAAK